MPECTVDAYAKINIGLSIGPRKPDGYHDIASIFQSVSLCDTITFRTTGGEGELSIGGIPYCEPMETTIAKAVGAIRKRCGTADGLGIDVIKRIPAMAGMGGGSADAAAALAGLNSLLRLGLSLRELAELSRPIGADVPFFLHGGAAAVSGIGERIQPIEPRTDFGLLVIEPGFGISTAAAYAGLDRFREGQAHDAGRPSCEGWESSYRGSILEWPFRNSFEPMLERDHPAYAVLRRQLTESGARFVSITGSGACMYGVYDSIEDAADAAGRFETGEFTGIDGPGLRDLLPGLRIHALQPLETSIVLR